MVAGLGQCGHEMTPRVGAVGEPVEAQRQGPGGRPRLKVGELDAVDRYYSLLHGRRVVSPPTGAHRHFGSSDGLGGEFDGVGGTLRGRGSSAASHFLRCAGLLPVLGRAVRALRRQHGLCGGGGRRRAAHHPRPRNRPPAARARARGAFRHREPGRGHRLPHAPALGPHHRAPVLHSAAARGGRMDVYGPPQGDVPCTTSSTGS